MISAYMCEVQINGANIKMKISQYTNDRELNKCLVLAISKNIIWLPKYYKTNNYRLITDAISKMVYASKVKKFVSRYLTFRENVGARIIQKHWRRCIVDPSYHVCKKRLLNEFNQLQQ